MTSGGSSMDPEWLVVSRARQMAVRQTAGPPGVERWTALDERARQARGDQAAMEGATAPGTGREAHEVLRSDLSSSLAFYDPQADTMVVEGRPTQVMCMITCASRLGCSHAEPCACKQQLQSPAPAGTHSLICCQLCIFMKCMAYSKQCQRLPGQWAF